MTKRRLSRAERDFIADYQRNFDYPSPALTTDLVIFTVIDNLLHVLLIERGDYPFKGWWALPGGFVEVGDGFVDQGEDLEAAARRELQEETSLPAQGIFLEQLYTFGRAGRDPRMRVISVAWYALVNPELAPLVEAGSDAAGAEWIPVGPVAELAESDQPTPHSALSKLAFDHAEILDTALTRMRGKVEFSDIAFELVPKRFTTAELRRVFSILRGQTYDAANFRRRFRRLLEDELVVELPGRRNTTTRPAKVFRFNNPRNGSAS